MGIHLSCGMDPPMFFINARKAADQSNCLFVPARTAVRWDLCLSVSSVMTLRSLGQKPFATALAPPGESRATTFGAHPSTEAMLTLTRAFGRLKSPFHEKWGRGFGAATVKCFSLLSTCEHAAAEVRGPSSSDRATMANEVQPSP
jgi:hypothetical protein